MENPKKFELKELVKNLVRKSKTKEALELIEKKIYNYLEDYSNLENSISIRLAELNNASEQWRNGISCYDDYTSTVAKINLFALKMVDEIKGINKAVNAEKRYEINQNVPFGIKEGNILKIIRLLQIGFCKSDGNFTLIYLTSGDSIYSSYSIKNLQERLPSKCFFRCHREYIINGYYINEYNKVSGSHVKMQNDQKIPISRGKHKEFEQFIQTFLYEMECLL